MTALRSVVRAVLLAGLITVAAHASLLFTDPGTNPLRYGDGFSLGTKFIVNSNNPFVVQVTALGLYDPTGTGFLQSHDIGLWDVTAGNLEVATVTIPTGAGATLFDNYRYITLSVPVDLVNGDQYILAAFYPVGQVAGVNDQLRDHSGGVNAATSADFNSFVAAFTSTGLGTSAGHLTEPNGQTSGTSYVGPNFQFTEIPEPGTLGLLACGLASVLWCRGRTRS